jgi:hypoxanthine-DNA glycosylase
LGGINISSQIIHPFLPIYNNESQILILGTFPSVKSREGEFYYHHPQNRFWKVISAVYQEEIPSDISQKKEMLLRNGVALWDVIKSCEITGSSDSSIRNAVANDLMVILKEVGIKRIYANGGTAERLYKKLILPITGRGIIKLPSTSPANATCSLNKLIDQWNYLIQHQDTDTKG